MKILWRPSFVFLQNFQKIGLWCMCVCVARRVQVIVTHQLASRWCTTPDRSTFVHVSASTARHSTYLTFHTVVRVVITIEQYLRNICTNHACNGTWIWIYLGWPNCMPSDYGWPNRLPSDSGWLNYMSSDSGWPNYMSSDSWWPNYMHSDWNWNLFMARFPRG